MLAALSWGKCARDVARARFQPKRKVPTHAQAPHTSKTKIQKVNLLFQKKRARALATARCLPKHVGET